eukprot:5904972-Pyramimonas_sp.AAC.1
MHKLCEAAADFWDRRWAILAAPLSPPLARPARQGGGPAPIQEIRGDLRKFTFMQFVQSARIRGRT